MSSKRAVPSRLTSDTLIDFIVDHVRRGDAKREEALDHYRQAGEGLLQLKLAVGHGEWSEVRDQIRSTLRISERRVQHFMKLANEWPVDWDRWQEICGNKKPSKPAPVKTPTPDPDDLEHALKLATMRDRGGTENERAVAAEKLSRFASTFDMTADVLETKASNAKEDKPSRENPDRGDSSFDREKRYWLDIIRKEAAEVDRETLFELLAEMRATIAIERGHRRKGA